MECNFSKNQGMNEGVASIEGQEILKSEQFRYSDSIIHAEGDIGANVTHRSKQDGLSGGMLLVSCVTDAYL